MRADRLFLVAKLAEIDSSIIVNLDRIVGIAPDRTCPHFCYLSLSNDGPDTIGYHVEGSLHAWATMLTQIQEVPCHVLLAPGALPLPVPPPLTGRTGPGAPPPPSLPPP